MIIETKRLILREMSQNDYEDLKKILQDEETMYAYNGAFNDAETQNWLDGQLKRYKEFGFGLWAVTLKDENEMIGQCGLTMQPWKGEKVLEVGYLFQRKYWHNGYATEAAKGCIDYAFNKMGAAEVCSIIRDINIPSRNVAERNGLIKKDSSVKHYRGVDMPHDRYIIYKKEM